MVTYSAVPIVHSEWVCDMLCHSCICGWLSLDDPPTPVVLLPKLPTGWCHQHSEGSWSFALQFVVHLEIHPESPSSPSQLGCWTSMGKERNLVGLLSELETILTVFLLLFLTSASCFLYSLASKSIKCRGYLMSIIVTQSLSWEIELNAFLKSTRHIQSGCWFSRALCG